jgi:16S rRNA (cytidine1402-2'-O)-methyltransferase
VTAGGGCLVVVATPIGNLGDLSPRAAATLVEADLVACEDTRHTGRLLELAGVRARRLVSLHAHNEAARVDEVLDALRDGATVALVSDAGTPLLSDPGERLVAAAAAAGVEVRAVPGPSAALCALVVSGLATDRFSFEGFLPRKGSERRARIAEIAAASQTSLCYESPHRVAATLADLAEACGPDRPVAVARELTKLHEETWRGNLGDAARRWAASETRGEHVIVIGGRPPRAASTGMELEEAMRKLRDAGLSARDAQRAAQALLGASRAEAYEAAHRPSANASAAGALAVNGIAAQEPST